MFDDSYYPDEAFWILYDWAEDEDDAIWKQRIRWFNSIVQKRLSEK